VIAVTVVDPWASESTDMRTPTTSEVGISSKKSYHLGMRAKVSEKGQVTIPKRLRDSLGIRPGDVLDFDEEAGRLVASKQVADADWSSLRGILRRPDGTPFADTDEFMAWVRPHRFGAPEERVAWLEESLGDVEGS
jgi:AbrB family looped-hinge helix DNA binding protein